MQATPDPLKADLKSAHLKLLQVIIKSLMAALLVSSSSSSSSFWHGHLVAYTIARHTCQAPGATWEKKIRATPDAQNAVLSLYICKKSAEGAGGVEVGSDEAGY